MLGVNGGEWYLWIHAGGLRMSVLEATFLALLRGPFCVIYLN